MYEFQISQLINARAEKTTMVLRYVALAAAALGLLACVWINPFLWALPAALCIFWWWRMFFHSDIEYEYLYFDGTIDIDKVIDKRKRKSVLSFQMDDVEVLAPVGSPAIETACRNAKVQYIDVSSRKPSHSAAFYEAVIKEADGVQCIRFEPEDRILDSICIKYSRKVLRKSSEGEKVSP